MPTPAANPPPQLPPLPEGPSLDRVRGPIEIPAYEFWQVALAIGGALCLLALLLWLFLRARRKTPKPKNHYAVAVADLNAASKQSNDEQFGVHCSNSLRRYLEDDLGLEFSARTSEEFLSNLKGNTDFDAKFQTTLREVLIAFDRIKFAQKELRSNERTQISGTVRKLIDQAHEIAEKKGLKK